MYPFVVEQRRNVSVVLLLGEVGDEEEMHSFHHTLVLVSFHVYLSTQPSAETQKETKAYKDS